jgi:hypothetical protein
MCNFFKNRKNDMHRAVPTRFTLKFADPFGHAGLHWFAGQLASAGCGDAIVDAGRPRLVVLEFERVSSSALKMILPAIEQVYAADATLRFVEVAPDLVCLREAAAYLGFTRQALARRALRRPGFPLAAHDGNPELFHLADVLCWARRTGRSAVTPALLDLAQTTRQVNLARQVAQFARWYVPARFRVPRFACERYGM